MKNIIIAVLVLILLAGGAYFFWMKSTQSVVPHQLATTTSTTSQATTTATATSTPTDKTKTVIGKSVEGRDITAYHYGEGTTELLFIGGIHGGYSWNTAVVAHELMNYLQTSSTTIPKNVKVTVIPVLNPDGLFKVAGKTEGLTKADIPSEEAKTIPGRFNAHTVDLNRNFDCDWKSTGTWQKQTVSGGSSAFSEPESKAVQTYVAAHKPAAVVAWYSAAGGVFASNCHTGVSDETSALTSIYASASGYKPYKEFDFYTITGDMMNWFAKENIPAISVLLTNHKDVEWDKNKKGVDAVLKQYAE